MNHDSDRDWVRLPGLFRRWELEQVIDPGADFHLEEAGSASDGTPLFALYRRERLRRHTALRPVSARAPDSHPQPQEGEVT